MKIIELLNKIANGEIETFYKFQYRNKIVTMGYLLDNYLFLEILNDEIESIEDTPKEENKIPEKLTDILRVDDLIPPVDENMYKIWIQTIKNQNKINEILDYLKRQPSCIFI